MAADCIIYGQSLAGDSAIHGFITVQSSIKARARVLNINQRHVTSIPAPAPRNIRNCNMENNPS